MQLLPRKRPGPRRRPEGQSGTGLGVTPIRSRRAERGRRRGPGRARSRARCRGPEGARWSRLQRWRAPAQRRPPLGFFAALWTTWRESVFRPVQFFRSLKPDGPVGPALAYYTLFLALGTFFTIYWSTLQTILAGGTSGLVGSELGFQLSPGQELTLLIAANFVYFVFAVVFSIVGLFLTVALVHVGFAIVGAGRQGFGATFRGLAYAGGPLAFALFPFFGGPISVVWVTVLAFIAAREVQRTTNLRAALGFLAPVLVFPMFLFLLVFIIGLILSAADIAPPA